VFSAVDFLRYKQSKTASKLQNVDGAIFGGNVWILLAIFFTKKLVALIQERLFWLPEAIVLSSTCLHKLEPCIISERRRPRLSI
jgi:hypothetical protein